MLQAYVVCRAVYVAENEEIFSDKGAHSRGADVDHATARSFGIDNIEVRSIACETARLRETRIQTAPIFSAFTAIPREGADRVALRVISSDLVGTGQSDVERIPGGNDVPRRPKCCRARGHS